MENEENTRLRIHGRFMKKKVFLHRLKRVEMGRMCGKNNKTKVESVMKTFESSKVAEGNRVVNITYMAKNMKCNFCQENLLMMDIESEQISGLGSIFSVRCGKCLSLTEVPSSEQHNSPSSGYLQFDINSRVALAAVHCGIGNTQVNNFLTTLNMPSLSVSTYKRHEREIGPIIETVSNESCEEAAKEERALAIEKAEELQKLLPENLHEGFIIPGKEDFSQVIDSDVVRIFVSFDMGWSKRGTGRQYDSLNGFAAIIGLQTGKVLSFIEFNRKCKACDYGQDKKVHDCRKNYEGTAKSMEAAAAVKLVVENEILKKLNLQVGVFIGDNDSASICAIRQLISYPIVKYSDMNHTKKGVTSLLYEARNNHDPDKELSADAIRYLQMCFGYAVKKNKGNIIKVQADIQNIPLHAFNKHDKCGDWCGYKKDPYTYNHSTIPGGFKSPVLFKKLVDMFAKLSENAEKFAAAASSQANESLNNTMSKRAPKAVCFSTSESSDFRFASSVGQKNLSNDYLQIVLERLGIDPGFYIRKEANRHDLLFIRKKEKAKTPEFKKNRRFLQKKRTLLKNKKENLEPELYKSNMSLLDMSESAIVSDKKYTDNLYLLNQNIEQCVANESSSDDICIVYFDLETTVFNLNCGILQIALKHKNFTFSTYINPTKSINSNATIVHGLTECQGQLLLHGKPVTTVPLRLAIDQTLQFLNTLGKPCLLVAHNCFTFDAPRLIRNICQMNLLQEYSKVVYGFVDTLVIFKQKFPSRSGKGAFTLTQLAHETMSLSVEGTHNAIYDAQLLQKLTQHHFTVEELIASKLKFIDAYQNFTNMEQRKDIASTLLPLENSISKGMINRLASAGISYDSLVDVYSKKGREEAAKVIQQPKSGKPSLIKKQAIVNKILVHLKDITNII